MRLKTPGYLELRNSQYFLNDFPVLGIPDELRQVKYFSLNPFLPDVKHRCPLECGYCVCHQDSEWHHHPDRFESEPIPETLIADLLDVVFGTEQGHKGFPISICDFSDPFIPVHKARVLEVIRQLIKRQATSMVYITTKVHPGNEFLEKLADLLSQPNGLRVTVFVSLAPLKPGYEKVSVNDRVQLLQDLTRLEIPCCWYLRPLIEDWFDETLMRQLAEKLVPVVSDHVILSGLVMSQEIENNLRHRLLQVPDWTDEQSGQKQLLNPDFEKKLRTMLQAAADKTTSELGPVMGHRLCGTNGNHAYGCLLCGKQDRYCQLFQLHHYDETVYAEDNQRLKELLVNKLKGSHD